MARYQPRRYTRKVRKTSNEPRILGAIASPPAANTNSISSLHVPVRYHAALDYVEDPVGVRMCNEAVLGHLATKNCSFEVQESLAQRQSGNFLAEVTLLMWHLGCTNVSKAQQEHTTEEHPTWGEPAPSSGLGQHCSHVINRPEEVGKLLSASSFRSPNLGSANCKERLELTMSPLGELLVDAPFVRYMQMLPGHLLGGRMRSSLCLSSLGCLERCMDIAIAVNHGTICLQFKRIWTGVSETGIGTHADALLTTTWWPPHIRITEGVELTLAAHHLQYNYHAVKVLADRFANKGELFALNSFLGPIRNAVCSREATDKPGVVAVLGGTQNKATNFQRRYDILFSSLGRLGVTVNELEQGLLDNASDLLDLGTGPKVHYRILLPGYPAFKEAKYIKCQERDGFHNVTRSKVAEDVMNVVRKFLATNEPVPVGGAHGIKENDILLAGISHATRGSWQPILMYIDSVAPGDRLAQMYPNVYPSSQVAHLINLHILLPLARALLHVLLLQLRALHRLLQHLGIRIGSRRRTRSREGPMGKQEDIWFSSRGLPGITVNELEQGFLDNADDLLDLGTGPKVHYRIQLPDSSAFGVAKYIKRKERGEVHNVTRAKIAKDVMDVVRKFIGTDRVRKEQVSESKAYRLKEDDVLLLGLIHATTGSWQPSLMYMDFQAAPPGFA
ncbi:hypothetical protein NM688_g1490 [Phlebia brevispora]|uniref:Uncharacterized protein n=1 Tax=Phlebia brevispora TaxID=194682 RepID=A0ACC1TBG7_9APHY|nr:hypothetical protein NM688_g1490 [Phlebia brevispora]